MNPLAILAMQQPVDIAGAFRDGQAQNALRQFAAPAMQGDQNALTQLAQYNPEMAFQIMSGRQQMDLRDKADARAERESQHSMKNDDRRVGISEQQLQIAQQRGREAAQEHAARMSAAERQADMEEAQKWGAAAQVAMQSDDAWSQFQSTFAGDMPDEFKGMTRAQAPMGIALMTGVAEGLGGVSAKDRYREVGGRLVDLYADGGPQTVMAAEPNPMSGIGKLAADLKSGSISQEQYEMGLRDMAPSGMSIESDGQGGFRMVQGPGVTPVGRPLTEAQSKDNMYLTMAEGAIPAIDNMEQNLVGLGGAANQAAGAVPMGQFLQSEQYQTARAAAMEFGAAILRKESGAALTQSDMEWMESRFIPVPGDKPATVQRKKEARMRAVAGLKAGMSAEQIRAVSGAIDSVPDTAGGPKAGVTEDGYRFKGGDPSKAENWEKVGG